MYEREIDYYLNTYTCRRLFDPNAVSMHAVVSISTETNKSLLGPKEFFFPSPIPPLLGFGLDLCRKTVKLDSSLDPLLPPSGSLPVQQQQQEGPFYFSPLFFGSVCITLADRPPDRSTSRPNRRAIDGAFLNPRNMLLLPPLATTRRSAGRPSERGYCAKRLGTHTEC